MMRLIDIIKQASDEGRSLIADVTGYLRIDDRSMTIQPSWDDDHIVVLIKDPSFRERMGANIPMIMGSLYTHACDCRLIAEFSMSDGAASIQSVESGICSFPDDGDYALNDGQYWPYPRG